LVEREYDSVLSCPGVAKVQIHANMSLPISVHIHMRGTQVHGLKTTRSYVMHACRWPGLHQTDEVLSNTNNTPLLLILSDGGGGRKLVVAKVKDCGPRSAACNNIITRYTYTTVQGHARDQSLPREDCPPVRTSSYYRRCPLYSRKPKTQKL